jgi:hypothetical protein
MSIRSRVGKNRLLFLSKDSDRLAGSQPDDPRGGCLMPPRLKSFSPDAQSNCRSNNRNKNRKSARPLLK